MINLAKRTYNALSMLVGLKYLVGSCMDIYRGAGLLKLRRQCSKMDFQRKTPNAMTIIKIILFIVTDKYSCET